MTEKTIHELLNFSILNIDKPSGPTSFLVDLQVKKALGLSKTSHFGTLDPKVTGVLPVALGRACRLSDYFMHREKKYVGIMRVHQEIEREKLEEEVSKFIGKIMQLPPVKSRVKREEREREVFSWRILEQDGKDFLFETEVEAGTYIRKLISDLGDKIGGAHMLELRRIKAGIFSEEDENFTNLYDFEKAVESWNNGSEKELRKILIPAEKALEKVLPVSQVKKDAVKQLLTGKPIFKEDIEKIEGERFAVFCQDRFIGVYKKVKEMAIIARPEFVFN
jgi:H/ACA ribonucleoprotein complex subunit 4